VPAAHQLPTATRVPRRRTGELPPSVLENHFIAAGTEGGTCQRLDRGADRNRPSADCPMLDRFRADGGRRCRGSGASQSVSARRQHRSPCRGAVLRTLTSAHEHRSRSPSGLDPEPAHRPTAHAARSWLRCPWTGSGRGGLTG